MYEGIRSPAIHMPKTMGDLVSAATRFPNATFWAGGTYLMSRHDYYPTRDSHDIISLSEIPELKKINRTDRFLEVGSMVDISQLISVGKQVIPDLLQMTLLSMATRIVRKQITIGGALCTPDLRLALPGTLAVLNSEVEVRTCDGPRSDSRWLPVSRLYDRSGALLLAKNEVVTRVRIGFEQKNFSTFMTAGNPMLTPTETVIFSAVCSYSQSTVHSFKFCFTLPHGGFYISPEIEMLIRGLLLPLSPVQVARITRSLSLEIEDGHQPISGIQKERIRRFFESTLQELNSQSLSEQ